MEPDVQNSLLKENGPNESSRTPPDVRFHVRWEGKVPLKIASNVRDWKPTA